MYSADYQTRSYILRTFNRARRLPDQDAGMKPRAGMRSVRTIGAERIIAWGLVALIHLLILWIATRPLLLMAVTSPPMELIYIQLTPPTAQTTVRLKGPLAQVTKLFSTRPDPRPQDVMKQPLPADLPAPPLQSTESDDRWHLTEPANKSEGIRISRNKLTDSYNPVQMGPPERFRMRQQLSPADIVRAVSKELFWPPGYTDDPCGVIEKTLQMLSGGSTPREQALLRDAIEQQQKYCR